MLVVDCCEYVIVLWRLNEFTPMHAAIGIDNLVERCLNILLSKFKKLYLRTFVRTYVQISERLTYEEQIFAQKPTAQFRCPI